jgi:Protein of unknown function (DUF3072)
MPSKTCSAWANEFTQTSLVASHQP